MADGGSPNGGWRMADGGLRNPLSLLDRPSSGLRARGQDRFEDRFQLTLDPIQALLDRGEALVNQGEALVKPLLQRGEPFVKPLLQLIEQFLDMALIEPGGTKDGENQSHDGNGRRDDGHIRTHRKFSIAQSPWWANQGGKTPTESTRRR